MLSSKGRFYTTSGAYLLELDVEKRIWTACEKPVDVPLYFPLPRAVTASSMPEATRVATLSPSTRNPPGGGPWDHGPLEMYLSRLATDDKGWVYCGIGVARYNLVAFNPATKERRQLVLEPSARQGRAPSPRERTAKPTVTSTARIHPLRGSEDALARGTARPARMHRGRGLGEHPQSAAGRPLDQRVQPGRQVVRSHEPKTGDTRRVTIDYRSERSVRAVHLPWPRGKGLGRLGASCVDLHLRPQDRKDRDPWPGAELAGGGFTGGNM